MERRVAAEVFLRKGHMPLDCRKRDSMVRNEQSKRYAKVSCEMGRRKESVGEILHTFRGRESGVDDPCLRAEVMRYWVAWNAGPLWFMFGAS